MKLVRWKRFTWELAKLPTVQSPLPDRYQLRAATREEEESVRTVVMRSLTLDTTWSDIIKGIEYSLNEQITASFARESIPALVLTHGPRIIAASVLSTGGESESHLISGPCVFIEYHNRGLASALLEQSLTQLHHAGLEHAHGITRDRSASAKFIYTKFGSSSAPFDPVALAIA